MKTCKECGHVDGDHELGCEGLANIFELETIIDSLMDIEKELDIMLSGAYVADLRKVRVGLTVIKNKTEEELYGK